MATWRLFLSHVKKYFTYSLCSLIKNIKCSQSSEKFHRALHEAINKLYNIISSISCS